MFVRLHLHWFNSVILVFETMTVIQNGCVLIHRATCMRRLLYFRVATAQGKPGIGMLLFPDRENTGNLSKNIKKSFLHGEFISSTGKILKF